MLDVNHFKQNRDVFSGCTKILEKKFVLEQISSPSNMIFFFFYEMLDEIDAFKRIQHFFSILHVG